MAPQKLKIAAAGLGRMGKRHALNFLNRTPRAELVAAFTPDPAEMAWAKQHLEPYGVTLYDDYLKMIDHPDLGAVVIGTATSVHAEESIQAMQKNLHVLCEKPLSTKVSICTEALSEAKRRPHLKVMNGFSRRFDESYRDAHQKMTDGAIGRPSIMRSQTCDKHDPTGFYIDYAAWSGGCFTDMSVHDIDLALWFFGDNITLKSISAAGVRAVQPELKKYNDFDNAVGIVEFWSGQIAYFYASRMMAAGQEDTTEIIGTEGKLTVNANAAKNHTLLYNNNGVVREIPLTYWGRFEQAFVTEANEFAAACLDDTALPLKLVNAVKAVEIGTLLQEALVSGDKLLFDELGRRIVEMPRSKL